VTIPSSWNDIDGSDWTDESDYYHYSIWAAPNLDDFYETWDTPGLIYEIIPLGDQQFGGYLDYLDDLSSELDGVCTYGGQEDYDDGAFQGAFRVFTECGGTGTGYFILSAYPTGTPDGYSVNIELQLVSDADWDTVDVVLDSFNVVSPIGQALPGGTASDDPYSAGGSTGGYSSYTAVSDDYNSIVVEVPSEWGEINGAPWTYDNEVIGAGLTAAPDLESFTNTWGTPGVQFLVSDDLANQIGYLQLLNEESSYFRDECEFDARYDYDDGYYRGKYDFFNKCGGSGGSSYMVLAAVSKTDQFSFLILVEVEIVTDVDWDAAQHILDTFDVIDLLP